MPILDRYILKRFLLIFLAAMVVFMVIFHIIDVIEKIDKFLEAAMSLSTIGTYYLYQLPYYINLAVPMSILLASVFTIGILAKHNELTAIKASGISLYRLSTPVLILGLLTSMASFFFEDQVVIPATRVRIDIEQNKMDRYRKYSKKVFTNITYQDSVNRNIVIGKFLTKNNTAHTITVQYTQNNQLAKRIDAKKMVWEPARTGWRLYDFKIRQFDDQGNELTTTFFSDSLFHFNLQPMDLTQANMKPEEMRYAELVQFIHRLRNSGNDPRRWEVNRHFKIAFAFTNFIVIMFGLSLTAMKTRKNMSFGAGISLLIIFMYYGFIKFGQVLGYKGILTPFLGAWLGNIIFFLSGAYLFYKIRQ